MLEKLIHQNDNRKNRIVNKSPIGSSRHFIIKRES